MRAELNAKPSARARESNRGSKASRASKASRGSLTNLNRTRMPRQPLHNPHQAPGSTRVASLHPPIPVTSLDIVATRARLLRVPPGQLHPAEGGLTTLAGLTRGADAA